MPPAAFLHPENAPKSLAAGASPQTPLGELTTLPRRPNRIKGPTSKGRGVKGGEGKRGEGRRDRLTHLCVRVLCSVLFSFVCIFLIVLRVRLL